MRLPRLHVRQEVTSMCGTCCVSTRRECGLAERRPRYTPPDQCVHVAGVGNSNLSNRTKRKENRYAGHNDDKQIIVAAAGGSDEWTIERRQRGDCVYTRTG